MRPPNSSPRDSRHGAPLSRPAVPRTVATLPDGTRAFGKLPDAADLEGRYRFMLEAAPGETVERATTAALANLDPTDRERLQEQLEPVAPEEEPLPFPRTLDPARLARLAARAEQHQPGLLESMLCALSPSNGRISIWSTFVFAFVRSEPARAFFAQERERQRRASRGWD